MAAPAAGRRSVRRPGARARSRWLSPTTRRRWLARWRRLSPTGRVLLGVLLALLLAVSVNAAYQVLRKPTELFFPLSGVLTKTPQETWQQYGAAFRRYATPNVPATLLAALAQQEGSGNPLVRTYWRFAWAARPFDLYRPASSAVGMYQITDGTFEEARHYCIHQHALVREGAWNDWHSCWFNGLYARVLPEDAIELTAAYLDLKVGAILARRASGNASLIQRRHLAAVVHLCGAGAAALYAAHGFRFSAAQRCGVHDPREYLKRVDEFEGLFARLAAQDPATDAPQ
jgi:Transglycosylase SLT domain